LKNYQQSSAQEIPWIAAEPPGEAKNARVSVQL